MRKKLVSFKIYPFFFSLAQLVLLSLLLVSYGIHAEVVFLTITPGARAIGMGQCFTAIADDPSACDYNPAGLAFITQPNVLSMNLSPPRDCKGNPMGSY